MRPKNHQEEKNNTATYRAFFAIDLPMEIKAQLAELTNNLHKLPQFKNLKWTSAENLHITLRFLGNITQKQQKCLVTKIKSTLKTIVSFKITMATLVPFPTAESPHVLSIKPEPTDLLLRLALAIDHAACACDLPADNKPFVPHLTLSRLGDNKLPRLEKIEFAQIEFPADSVCLFKSEPEKGKSKYTLMEKFPLVG